MYKALVTDAALYSISTVLGRGFSLITVPIFTRILAPSDYGALDLLSYFAVFIPIIAGLALDQAVARFYPEATHDPEKKKIASTVIFYYLGAVLLTALAGMYFSAAIAEAWLDNQVDKATVAMAFIFVWVHSLYYVLNNQLRYMFLAKKFAFCNIGNTILSMILSVWFIASLELGVFGVFLAQTISQACFAILSLYYGRESYAFSFDRKCLGMMIRYSAPLVPGSIAFFAMQYVDRYALNELRGLEDVGLYGIGARLASLVNLFLIGFQRAWFPIVMKTYKTPGAQEQFSSVFRYFVFASSTVIMVVSVFSEEILLLLTTAEFSQGYVVVPLLLASAVLACIGNYFSFGIQIRKKSAIRLYINLAGLVLNIALNLVLIPVFGLVGAALATFSSFLIMAVVAMTLSQKLYWVPYQWHRIIAASGMAVVLSNVLVGYSLEHTTEMLLFKALLTILALIIMARVLKIAGLRDVYTLIRRRV